MFILFYDHADDCKWFPLCLRDDGILCAGDYSILGDLPIAALHDHASADAALDRSIAYYHVRELQGHDVELKQTWRIHSLKIRRVPLSLYQSVSAVHPGSNPPHATCP